MTRLADVIVYLVVCCCCRERTKGGETQSSKPVELIISHKVGDVMQSGAESFSGCKSRHRLVQRLQIGTTQTLSCRCIAVVPASVPETPLCLALSVTAKYESSVDLC